MAERIKLGVNVDHVATVRQARMIDKPDPAEAALLAEKGGADGITVHLREDRRHIQDHDIKRIRESISTSLNFEMGLADDIKAIALETVPECVTLVPEKREEVTTEGGLDVISEAARIEPFVDQCKAKGIEVSFFIDPDPAQIEKSKLLGADAVELHTGQFCERFDDQAAAEHELTRLEAGGKLTLELGMRLLAGHGLDYDNVKSFVKAVHNVEEVNIGHSIIGRSIFVGIEEAVREMRELLVY